ncbi:MAG: SIS domain-containing protein [Candidatus Tumulicola sp.]
MRLGERFESEIREQPAVWCRLAESGNAAKLAQAIADRDVVLLGSGSSLFAAQIGAFALRRRGVRAHALAATEAPLDGRAYRDAAVIACSQSGESDDLLHALDALRPRTLVALTNRADSTLGERASTVIDVGAGTELAVPASKSVSATVATLLWAADCFGPEPNGRAHALVATAQRVAEWLDGPAVEAVRQAAQQIARQRSVIVVGAGYGLPIAHEAALKMKEASYVHAEGFAAGEFLHGSAAILDPACTIVGIVDDLSRHVVERPMRAAARAGSPCYVLGAGLGDVPLLGPESDDGGFGALAWLVAAQTIALFVGRARGVDSDAPRGQSKVLLDEVDEHSTARSVFRTW